MSLPKLVLAEICGRPLNFAISILAIAIAGTMFLVGPTLVAGYSQETSDQLASLQQDTDQILADMDKQTKRIMRDLGVNLRIVHQNTNLGGLYTDFQAEDFPEDYVNKLAQSDQIETIVHLIATLQQPITWNRRKVMLVGILPVMTVSQKNEEKAHMAKPIEPGTVVVGHELGADLAAGQAIDILGQAFTIAEIRPAAGTIEDVQLVVDLHDAQQLLNKPGRVHQILALNCKCHGDRISVIRRELEGVLPDTRVTEDSTRATAREKQRDLVAKNSRLQLAALAQNRSRWEQTLQALNSFLLPVVVAAAALFVGILTWLNVRQRTQEIGLLRALGKSSGQIAFLFLSKSLLVGILGGVLSLACYGIGWSILEMLAHGGRLALSPQYFWPTTALISVTLAGAPLLTAIAAYLPTLLAVRQDPAVLLVER